MGVDGGESGVSCEDQQGTGDRIWVQVGETPDNFVKIPLTQAEADGTENWYKHLCFVGMGYHYMEFNYEIDQDCNSCSPCRSCTTRESSLALSGSITPISQEPDGSTPMPTL